MVFGINAPSPKMRNLFIFNGIYNYYIKYIISKRNYIREDKKLILRPNGSWLRQKVNSSHHLGKIIFRLGNFTFVVCREADSNPRPHTPWQAELTVEST